MLVLHNFPAVTIWVHCTVHQLFCGAIVMHIINDVININMTLIQWSKCLRNLHFRGLTKNNPQSCSASCKYRSSSIQVSTWCWCIARSWWKRKRFCVLEAGCAAGWACHRRWDQNFPLRWWAYWALDLVQHWCEDVGERERDGNRYWHNVLRGKL